MITMEYTQKSVRLPRTPAEKEKWKRVIIILEHCPLQSIQTDRGFELLSERHRAYHARHAPSDPAEWRPDVVHQCLLHLQDSALNRAGKLEVFLCTKKGICISVDPRLRIPRHMHFFEKMMVTLLFKMRVRANIGYLSLLRVVKNPVTDHIPANTMLFRVEKDGELITDWETFCQTCGTNMKRTEEKETEKEAEMARKRRKGEEDVVQDRHHEHTFSSSSSPPPATTTTTATTLIASSGDGASSPPMSSSYRNKEPPHSCEDPSSPVSSRSGSHGCRHPNDASSSATAGALLQPSSLVASTEGDGGGGDGREEQQRSSSSSSPQSSTMAEAGTSAFANLTRRQAENEQFRPFAFIVGGMSKGDVTVSYASQETGVKSIRISDRGMSAAAVLSQLMYAFEEAWLKEDNELC